MGLGTGLNSGVHQRSNSPEEQEEVKDHVHDDHGLGGGLAGVVELRADQKTDVEEEGQEEADDGDGARSARGALDEAGDVFLARDGADVLEADGELHLSDEEEREDEVHEHVSQQRELLSLENP